MAGFTFGNVGELNASVTVQCFVYVVFFIMFFDAFVGVIEYFLEGSPLYHRMIQTIYKELMLMGIVSFIITMILALESYKHTHSEEGTKWIKGIEFAHILLFFLTFFFVGHACILMRTSFKSRTHYRTTFALGVSEVLNDTPSISTNPIQYFLFKFNIFPAIGVKEKMELWLFHELFRATYWLPHDFNFADYLSGCFDQYILKTIERSFFTWMVLIVLSVLNYARIRLHIGFQTCKRPNASTESAAHRLLGGDSSSTATAVDGDYDEHVCNYNMFRLFLFGGAVLVLCNFIVVYVARLYRVRMFYRIGILSTYDYVDFLEFVRDDDEKELAERKKSGASSSSAMTTVQLKNDIQTVLDEDEHQEEVEFKELAEAILSTVNYAWELKDSIVVTLRSTWARVVRGVQTRKFNLISPLGVVDTEAHGDYRSETASNSPNSDPHNTPSSSKLSHLHRSSTRPNIASSATAGNKPTVINKDESPGSMDTRSAEKTTADNTVTATIPCHAPTSRTQGGRRRSIVGDGAHSHAQMESIRSLLSTLDSPADLDGNHLHTGVNRPNRTRLHSQESATLLDNNNSTSVSVTNNNSNAANHSSTNASHASGARTAIEGRRRTSILMSNAASSSNSLDGRRDSLIDHGASPTRRRNSVHVVAPKDELSRVERYKLLKAQKDPSYTIALKKMHDQMLVEQARLQATEGRTWWVWCLSWFSSNGMQAEKVEVKATISTDIENSAPKNEDLKENTRLNEDFHSIYIFGEPTLFVRIIEITIMFNCLYMAFWLSNFITITGQLHTTNDWEILNELAMLIPIVLVIPCVIYISETASLLSAISELNLRVIYQVLCDTEDTQNLLRDFKRKLRARIAMIQSHNFDKDEILRILFEEIDQDGSGVIDMTEFRVLLRHLKLKYSDDRFKRLFHAIAGDSAINFEELKELVDNVGDDEDEEDPVAQSRHGNSRKITQNNNLDARRKNNNNHNNNSNTTSDNGESALGSHSRLTPADLRNKISRPDRLKKSLSGNSSSSSNNLSHISEKRVEVKSDDDSDSALGGDQFMDIENERLSQIQSGSFQKIPNLSATSTISKLRSVSSVDYSDTDSDEEGNNSGKKKRLSHRKSGCDRKLIAVQSPREAASATVTVVSVGEGQRTFTDTDNVEIFSFHENNDSVENDERNNNSHETLDENTDIMTDV